MCCEVHDNRFVRTTYYQLFLSHSVRHKFGNCSCQGLKYNFQGGGTASCHVFVAVDADDNVFRRRHSAAVTYSVAGAFNLGI